METKVTVTFDPPDLIERMQKYPDELKKQLTKGMDESMLHIQGSVPGYPPPPPSSRYRRTGTLGRSLTIGGGGNIKSVRAMGSGVRGEFGTRIFYAPRVIGEGTQRFPWSGYWWHMGTVRDKARPGIIRIFQKVAERMASFLNGR